MITLREFREEDMPDMAILFYDTVHSVNAVDYSKEQLDASAPDRRTFFAKTDDIKKQYALVAEEGGVMAGFGSITADGELDLLYVSKDFQRRGVATALCDRLEKGHKNIVTYASVTSKGFFEKRGYIVLKRRMVLRRGVKLAYYKLLKSL